MKDRLALYILAALLTLYGLKLLGLAVNTKLRYQAIRAAWRFIQMKMQS